jgi:hypothetical protein
VGLIPAAIGLVALIRKDREWGVFTLLVAIFNVAFVIEYHFYLDVYAFLFPTFIVTAMWFGAGLKKLSGWLGPRGRIIECSLSLMLIAAQLSLFPSEKFLDKMRAHVHGFPSVDLRDARQWREFINHAVQNLERDALVVAPWHQFTLLKYAQTVEGARPDLIVILHKHTRLGDLLSPESDPEILRRLSTPGKAYFVDARGIMPFGDDSER